MKAKEIAMVVALAILTALFFGLLVDAIYVSPRYEDFCKKQFERPLTAPLNQDQCNYKLTVAEQEQVDKCYSGEGFPEFNQDSRGCQTSFKSCNTCNKEFNEVQKKYNLRLFYILAPIAVILVVVGLFLELEVVGTGLMFAGILLLVYTTGRGFESLGKVARVFVIFVELVLLILISIRKLKK